ncbi:MAG: AraC family transcriptional regulator [bacterium]|nr:AraC family transcriptional regulator [bacterium]
MLLAPDQLLQATGVEIIARSGDGAPRDQSTILFKSLGEALHDRSVFARVPSLTFLDAGEKIVSVSRSDIHGDEDDSDSHSAPSEARFDMAPGDILALPADLYQISDLLAPDGGSFESLIVFIAPARLADFVRTLPTRGLREALEPPPPGTDVLKLRSSESLRLWQSSLRPLFRSLSAHVKPDANAKFNASVRFDASAKVNVRGKPDANGNHHLSVASLLQTKLIEGLQLLYMNNPAIGEWARRMSAPLDGENTRDLRGFMLRHYDRPLSVEDFAQLTGRSSSTFLRDFKRCFGQTPRDWLLDRRMDRARERIEAGHRNITELASELGYESISHFIRNFKRRFGKTPGNWARKIQENILE